MIPVDPASLGRGIVPVAPSNPYEPPADTPNWLPSFGAYGRMEPGILMSGFGWDSDVTNAAEWLGRDTFPEDPDFELRPMLEGTMYEQYFLDRFIGVRSEDEARATMARIDRELKYQRTLDAAGWRGWVASVAAGIISPTNLIPVGGWLRTGGKVGSVALRAGEGALAVGAAVGIQEGVLQGTQETRTAIESVFNIGGAAIVGGLIGGGIRYLEGGDVDRIARGLNDIPGTLAEEADHFRRAVDLSAASSASARGDGSLAPSLGGAAAFGTRTVGSRVLGQDPLLRLQTSPFSAARNAVRDLAETPLNLAENADGIATTQGGAVETRMKMARGPLSFALREMDDAYTAYFFGGPLKLGFGPARGTFAVMRGAGGGKLTYSQFKEQIFDALMMGDVHPIPEVAKAAHSFRSRVFDPLKKAAVEAGLFPEDIKPVADLSYVPRMYNTEMIAARRTQFVDILARHFEARQREILEQINELERKTGADDIDPKLIKPKWVEQTPGEIRSMANEVTNTIMGNAPSRILGPQDLIAGPRGPLKERMLRIPTALIRDFVERDPEALARRYTETMSGDVNLVKMFGSTDMADQIAKVNDEADALVTGKGEAESKRIEALRKAAVRDLAAIRDRLRGTYELPKTPDGMLVRSGQVARNLNYLRLLGGMTISAFSDAGKLITIDGFDGAFRTALHPFIRGLGTFKLAAKEAKLAGTALDMVLDSRIMAFADIADDYGRASKFERGLAQATRYFARVSLMAQWNSAIKQFAAIIAQRKMFRSIERVVAGTASKKEIEYLASGGIDANMAERIALQFEAHGVKDGDVWWANSGAWTDQRAVESFRAILVRDVDRAIVTPGAGDRPIWMSGEMGKTIGQFKSFQVASIHRTLLAGMQQRDMAAFSGMAMMIALGMLSYWTKAEIGGYDVSDDWRVWVTEGIDRSGVIGWLGDANNIVEKMTRGRVGMSAFTGEQSSRYASRNLAGAMLGPTFDALGDLGQVSGAAFAGDWTASDTRALRKMIPLQNLFWLRKGFDAMEQGVNQAFGVPAKR